MTTKSKQSAHDQITNTIIEALEHAQQDGGALPWVADGLGPLARPSNFATRNQYNGINILLLWIASHKNSFTSHQWGTYRQWAEKGGNVRKGEKGTPIVFFKEIRVKEPRNAPALIDENGELIPQKIPMLRVSYVFNLDQVDGIERKPISPLPDGPLFDPIRAADNMVRATGAQVNVCGDAAYYHKGLDVIHVPEKRRFLNTKHSTAAEGFYSVLFHELTHWSGAKKRLDRDLTGRFGSEAYAMEELIAELGAAFLCADLGVSNQVRPDHSHYIKNWLQVLKDDNRAVFAAAKQASLAADFLKNGAVAPLSNATIAREAAA